MKLHFKRISVISGHYGSGKTNLAVNLALRLAAQGERVTLVDLDIVNPYFRTADFRAMLEEKGVRVLAPVYANTNLDIPALPPDISSVFDPDSGYAIFDVGGDDAGAIALGQFAQRMDTASYDMFYVVNARRYMTQKPEEAAALLKEIEAASRLKATRLVNNTNLGPDTTMALVRESLPFAEEVSRITGLELAFTCIPRPLAREDEAEDFFPVDIHVRAAWENEAQ